MSISRRFQEEGFEFKYKGKTINRIYSFAEKGTHILRFTIISSSSPYVQAIHLHLSGFKGRLSINGKSVEIPKGKFPQVVFAENSSPRQFDLKVELDDGSLCICNSCCDEERLPGIFESLVYGCGMIIEKTGDNHFRFFCNDTEDDDDFDDFIFEMEITKER